MIEQVTALISESAIFPHYWCFFNLKRDTNINSEGSC